MGTQAARKNVLKLTRASRENTQGVGCELAVPAPRPRRRTIESFCASWLRARHQRRRRR